MNTREKIDMADDASRLFLHKEGIFYTLYNQHAMLFTENIKELKIKARFIKVVNQQVYSCGFPASIIEEIKRQLVELGGQLEESDKLITVVITNWPREPDYIQWCKEQKQEEIPAEKKSAAVMSDIEKQIVGFQVIRKTPMEAMSFILELQEQLNRSQ